MPNFSSHLQWFQAKIGSYDKQIWETSVEQRILQGLENRPKREGSLHKELIDIDLVRGSTFSKAKPRHGMKSVIFNGLKRVIFFPLYYHHWRDHLTKEVVNCCLFHYTIQMVQLILYFMWSNSTEIMIEEISLPIVLSLGLGVLHAHIVAPYTVKQRRKKTLSAPTAKGKPNPKSEIPPGVTSRKPSLKPAQQQSDGIIQPTHNNFNYIVESNIDNVLAKPENYVSNRPKKKVFLYLKSTSIRGGNNDDEFSGGGDGKKPNNMSQDYSETETKDSSSSEQENDVVTKMVTEEEMVEMSNDPSCTEALCTMKKRPRSPDSSERKNKPVTRQGSQSYTSASEIPDEEDLKKFITAKYKKIPDPTPMNNIKKEKQDKLHWKQSASMTNSKPYKNSKSRRAINEWVGLNSPDTTKIHKSTSTNLTDQPCSMNDDNNDGYTMSKLMDFHELNGTNQDSAIDDSMSDKQMPTIKEMETLAANNDMGKQSTTECMMNGGHSISQPHTPINYYSSKLKHRIEVRKVSSANASPTPSRRNSTCFSTPVDLNREHLHSKELNHETHIVTKHSLSNSSQEQESNASLADNGPVKPIVIDNSISSEDMLSKMIDLNEDTITKSHKKREEFKQLFEIKAQNNPKQEKLNVNSSSSSSRKSSSEVKHSKVKRRYREDLKSSSAADNYSKSRKEIVQSMSETEADRMNSDVNSTGNSTSDGEDMLPNALGTTKAESEKPLESDEKTEFPPNIYNDISSPHQSGTNENNLTPEEYQRPPKSSGNENIEDINEDPFLLWYKEIHTPGPLNGVNESVSCYIWEEDELKKTNLSLLDIGWSIIQAVERHEHDKSYSKFGFLIMIFLCFTPIFFRIYVNWNYLSKVIEMTRHTHLIDFLMPYNTSVVGFLISPNENTSLTVSSSNFNVSQYRIYNWSDEIIPLTLTSIIGSEWPIRSVVLFGVISRIILYSMTFLMLCVAENSFEQRLQYAKHFCRLTSSRRARKYYLPHFRLNKLANIKCWLSLRSYLKKRGPQRSVESIISSAFYMLLAMLSLVCVNLLQNGNNSFVNKLINWDFTLCSLALGIFMMRFLVLGTKITKKYRNLSVIITEQINLFLAMQTRPHKKEELTLAHNVLRLAESLLKEVEGPFRICGWSMNPFLYNILKVVILSVFSTVLSETCGFKMKLYKIKINPSNW